MVYINNMLRTQIYLPESQLKILKRKAADGNTSVSEIVRQAIDTTLLKKQGKKKFRNAGASLLAMARKAKKMGVKGPRDLATNMDKYLYDKDFR